jgi:hypothetical protein
MTCPAARAVHLFMTQRLLTSQPITLGHPATAVVRLILQLLQMLQLPNQQCNEADAVMTCKINRLKCGNMAVTHSSSNA